MGRIAWLDGRSRLAVGGSAAAAAATDLVLSPIHDDLLRNTWMYVVCGCAGWFSHACGRRVTQRVGGVTRYERYQCGAQPTHNPYYIEVRGWCALGCAHTGPSHRVVSVCPHPWAVSRGCGHACNRG